MILRCGIFLDLIYSSISGRLLAQLSSEELNQTTYDPYLHGAVPSRQPTLAAQFQEDRQKEMLLVSAADIIHGSNPLVWRTAEIREASDQCASFEVGFVFRTMEESYRKMLDIYNTTVLISMNHSNMDHLVYLQKIEQLQFEVYHYHNMMHEIERKYKMNSVINGSGMFEGGQRWRPTTTLGTRKTWIYTTKKPTTSWWHPLEYGWKQNYYDQWRR